MKLFLLIGGVGDKMDSWEPSILKNLSTYHTVIVFDNRGVGNTTTGTKPFSIQQLANDTAGLLEALKIQKADILGYSLGSFVAQQLAVTHPEKVNKLLLVAASCGGKENISPSPQLLKIDSEVIKNATNNLPISVRTLMNLTMGPELKSHLLLKEPPCITRIIDSLRNGEEISNAAKVLLSTYELVNGKTVSDIAKMVGGGDLRVNRYQIEHLGLRDSSIVYPVPTCYKALCQNLCYATNECAGIKSPLEFGKQGA